MQNELKPEQSGKASVQPTNPPAADLQKKKPSNKTEGSLQPTAGDKKPSSDTQNLKSQVYSMGANVSSEVHNLLTMYEGLDLLITEKKDRSLLLQEMTKPISREQRRLGKKSPISQAHRTAAKTEIKKLKLDIVPLERDRRNVYKRLTGRADDVKSTISDQIYREYSQSEHYLNRNGKRIILNVSKLLNKVRSESIDDVIVLVNAAKKEGTKSRTEFQTAFLDFLRKKRYQLYILCTGKEAFQKSVVDRFRKALKTWNPRRKDLAL